MIVMYGYLAKMGHIYLFSPTSCSMLDSSIQCTFILHRILRTIKAISLQKLKSLILISLLIPCPTHHISHNGS